MFYLLCCSFCIIGETQGSSTSLPFHPTSWTNTYRISTAKEPHNITEGNIETNETMATRIFVYLKTLFTNQILTLQEIKTWHWKPIQEGPTELTRTGTNRHATIPTMLTTIIQGDVIHLTPVSASLCHSRWDASRSCTPETTACPMLGTSSATRCRSCQPRTSPTVSTITGG